jgi:hypothetical protein
MAPRIIHIPPSGGDRKAQAKGIRYAHGIHESAYRESVLIRSAAEAKIRDADRLECEAWNAIMRAVAPLSFDFTWVRFFTAPLRALSPIGLLTAILLPVSACWFRAIFQDQARSHCESRSSPSLQ